METSLKLALPKFSLAAQKIWAAQNLGGATVPLAPPARTPMDWPVNIKCKLNAAKEFREWQLAFIKQLIL